MEDRITPVSIGRPVTIPAALHGMMAAVVLGILAAVPGAAGPEPSDRMITVDSHALHAVVMGSGKPAVVIDGGIGARCEEYRGLQERLAGTTTVVAYDRAGYGSSTPGPLPRDSRAEAEELRLLLDGLGIPRPCILVGHSLGGLNVQVYAGLHPAEVAGMVLLDPPPLAFIRGEAYPELAALASGMTDQWQKMGDDGLKSESVEEKAEAGFFLMLASEHREMFAESARQAAAIRSFDDIPLAVVGSGVPNPRFGEAAEPFQAFWKAESESLAAKSTRGRFIFAATSTHRLQDDDQDQIVETILSMVGAAAGRGR